MTQVIEYRGVTITIQRPELTLEERKKRERDIVNALSLCARAMSKGRG